MKLYLLTTISHAEYYVIAESLNNAEAKLIELLNKADYGFYAVATAATGRIVKKIKILAEEVQEFPKGKPNFNPDLSRLILPNSCESKDTQVDINNFEDESKPTTVNKTYTDEKWVDINISKLLSTD
ncbi:hypothetical protein KKH23_07260 [Patescibacteria group bacterium]|nr:hypothetical protein [Patescibacteria group bacterium]